MKFVRYLALACTALAATSTVALACVGGRTPSANASEHACCAASAKSAAAPHAGTGATTAMAHAVDCPYHVSATLAAPAGTHGGLHALADPSSCPVCVDEAMCDDELRAAGARAQMLSLRNGAMIVYTADDPARVRGLQAAVSRHNQRVLSALSGSGANLCSDCKKLRGALASGKYVREVVNVERGCQLLLTSSDPRIVQQIHEMTGPPLAARTKS